MCLKFCTLTGSAHCKLLTPEGWTQDSICTKEAVSLLILMYIIEHL